MFAKPIICAALACASLTHAVRREFKMEKPSGLLEGVSALIQKHSSPKGAKSAMQILSKAQKAVQGITPGAKEAMDVALRGAISEIQNDVKTQIVAAHQDTQEAINTALQGLTSTTNTALDAFAAANVADARFVASVEEELSRLRALEQATAALAAAREAKVQPCAEQDAAAPYSREFSEVDLVFECDISIAGNCDAPLGQFKDQVSGLLSDLEEDVTTATGVFTAAKARCDAAKAAIVAAEAAQAEAREQREAAAEQRLKDHEARQVDVCVFGMDLADKCSARSAFEALNAEIDGAGNVRSNSDRMSEWATAAVTTCMLQLIIDSEDLVNININEQSLASCEASVNFAQDVGVLGRKADEFAALTTTEKFTCAETEVTFSGVDFNIPVATADSVVRSEQFERIEPFSVPVSAKNAAKFDFCAVAA